MPLGFQPNAFQNNAFQTDLLFQEAFQATAFQGGYPGQTAYQTFTRTVGVSSGGAVTIKPLLVIDLVTESRREMLTQQAGTSIVITAKVTDPSQTPPMPFDPTSVQVNLRRPDRTVAIALGTMTRISTGEYRYIFQSISSDQEAAWEVQIKAVSGANTVYTPYQVGFVLAA